MARGLSHSNIVNEPDGTVVGHWGPYVLQTAFQPIFAFEKGHLRPYAFEALVRPSRDDSALSPKVFFKAVPAIDRLAIETLSRDIQILNAAISLGPDVILFINFDPSLFCDRAIVDAALGEMRDVVARAGLRPERIVCEVTEQYSTSASALQDFVAALRSDGYGVAVDDYGTQSSDMERVKQLQPDIVKFDAKWIVRLMETRPGIALLSVMVEEFHQKNIRTVFEGIEEEWQIDVAAEIGVSMVQGFALARPQIAPTNFAALEDDEPPPGTGTGHRRSGRAFGRRRM